jgi:hypothetical protein
MVPKSSPATMYFLSAEASTALTSVPSAPGMKTPLDSHPSLQVEVYQMAMSMREVGPSGTVVQASMS